MRRVLALVLLFSCISVHADDAAERGALAQRLADLLEVRTQYSLANARCRQSDADLERALLELLLKHPVEFGGLSPKSEYWPEARTAYREYVDSACELTSGDRLEPLFVKNYAETMTVADLRAAEAFYSSPAGRTLQAANRKIFEEVTELAYRRANEAQPTAAALTYRQSMLILRNKYKQDPR